MAELDEIPNFGIENTIDTGGIGDQNIIDSLLSPESSTTDPASIQQITPQEKGGEDGKGADGKADVTALAGKDNVPPVTPNDKDKDKVPDDKALDPEKLTEFLTSTDDDDDDVGDGKGDTPSTTTETTAEVPDNNADEKDKGGSDGEGGSSDDEIAFDNLANELANLGVFSKLEGEEDGIQIKSGEDFLERFKKEKELGANQMISNFIGQFGEDYQQAFQAIFVNGANPKEYFAQSAQIEDYKNLDLSQEQNQERVVREVLQEQGFEGEDIDNEIDRLKNYGDLEDTSKRHHKVLVKKQASTLAEKAEQAKQLNLQKQQQKQQYVENVRNVLEEKIKAKEFDGIPVNPQTANELQDFLLVDKWKTESGETLTDFDKAVLDLKRPENHQQKVKVALLLKLIEKDPTLSTIQKRGVSKESSQLFKGMTRKKTAAEVTTAAKKNQQVKSWFKQ